MGRHSARHPARRPAQRPPYDRCLIVTEGEQTERRYFMELRRSRRLRAAHVEVVASTYGPQARKVVASAEALFLHGDPVRHISARAFEHVFAVFDWDGNPAEFHPAVREMAVLNGTLRNDAKQPVRFSAIPSRPSFEYWLLLHFRDVRHMVSSADALDLLKREWPAYAKSHPSVFAETQGRLAVALERARKIAAAHDVADDTVPFTAVHELVQQVLELGT